MPDKDSKSIRLMVNRQERTILVNTILYAQVTDKLCTIYLLNRTPLRVFLTISTLKAMLPSDGFFQISRSCLVALQYIQDITNDAVIMSNSDRLPYSRRKKTEILDLFQAKLAERAAMQEAAVWKLDLASEFHCFDHCPIPFFILEFITDSHYGPEAFVFRYANEAFASLTQTPLHRLMHMPVTALVRNAEPKWLRMFSQVALYHSTAGLRIQDPVRESVWHLTCYQPHYGFCACLLAEITHDTDMPRFSAGIASDK